MTVMSGLWRLLGRRHWLSSLRQSDPALADEAARVMGGEINADAFLERQLAINARYLRGAGLETSEAELNQLAWDETVAGLPAELVVRFRPGA